MRAYVCKSTCISAPNERQYRMPYEQQISLHHTKCFSEDVLAACFSLCFKYLPSVRECVFKLENL